MKKICGLIILMLTQVAVSSAHEEMHWMPANCTQNREQLFNYFNQAPLLGLDPHDYAFTLVKQLNAGNVPGDSLAVDKLLSQAAISFFSDVAYGTKAVRVYYDGLKYVPDCLDIPQLLYESLSAGSFGQLLTKLEPSTPEYVSLKRLIAVYTDRIQRNDYHNVQITSANVDSNNHPLIDKLFQLGFLDTCAYNVHEDTLLVKTRAAQYMFEFLEDGELRPKVLDEFNISLEKRLVELHHALNTFRWLNCLRKTQPVIVVNIPAAGLFVYKADSTLLYSRVIVGKARTPTTPLASRINEVIMFPYWNVPHNIAVKELLPGIKGAPKIFLEAGNYQVLDKSGKIVDPLTINWQALNKHYFPYTLRQVFGCDNSLGIIKLDFFNPYSTYLHDTPAKSYFMFNSRYFSHGCIRLEEAIPLATLIAPENAAHIDSLSKLKIAPIGAPINIAVAAKPPVIILYEVAWPGVNGVVRFFDDVYEKFR
ncbi:L,D-transpeptidase scaffold domain-containing protein [Chitinophaga agri]|uniref:L,D-transpeptidase family protein n=1 Tax=Chitinophaga agri TaxID=2703787 RepID=A0A6B9Z7H0_9BACT|nr:L,D-transpeptidase family protein [Chitinophaga agri]QHS58170.1 L,D-transpeptidase family protein [Chitinophaga agri]